MLQAFNTQIRPLNDELGRMIRNKKIKVKQHEKCAERVEVLVKVYRPDGTRGYCEARHLRNLRALGVVI